MGRSPGLGRSVRSSSPPSTEVSQIDAERIVLDEARAGLIQGDPERALAHIETHRTKYPEGFLAEERDAMQVEALARAGRYEDARRAAARFRARRPSSMYTSTVDDAIASIP
jgi:outer membrane protein assembly factor BamD (BamD/ComL family)